MDDEKYGEVVIVYQIRRISQIGDKQTSGAIGPELRVVDIAEFGHEMDRS